MREVTWSSCEYADDFIVGFQYRWEAERFQRNLRERLAKFGLELKAEKTRLIEFGRFAAKDRKARGLGGPETFNFLGFTHVCGKTRDGRFTVKRITIKERMRAKLQEVKSELRRRMHLPIPEVGRWLGGVVRGHLAYFAVPGNSDALVAFRRPSQTALAESAPAPEPEGQPDMGAYEPAGQNMAAPTPRDPSLPKAAV